MIFKFCTLLLIVSPFIYANDTTERKCKDGKSYFDGCNTITCMNGLIASTDVACAEVDPTTGAIIHETIRPPPEDFFEKEENELEQIGDRKCKIGKSYNDGCNTCTCMKGGIGCTLMMCLEKDPVTGEFTYDKTKNRLPPPEDFFEPI